MRIIQFLNWNLNSIIDCLDDVKRQNFDTIQINPMQPFIDTEGYDWWASYQPLDFKVGNIFGSKEDLKKLCEEANKRGIKIVVDVITNHLANDGAGREIIPNRNIKKEIRDNEDFWKNHPCLYDFSNYSNIINGSIGLPGLNLKNEELQDIILNFLDELRKCGVSGFRFDAAKHIGLPSDGVSYFERVKEFLDKNNMFAYAEFLDGPNDISFDLTKTIYDKKNEFTDLMYILTEDHSMVKNPSKKVAFHESHDTYLNENGYTRYMKTEDMIDEYAKLTKKYENTLFYVRDKSYGKSLSTNDPNRADYADTSWMYNDKIKKANLNNGREEKNMEEYNKHHLECMEEHKRNIEKILKDSTVNDCIILAITDYNNQIKINNKYGIAKKGLFDQFLMNCVMHEFFTEKYFYPALSSVGYNDFYEKTLYVLEDQIKSETGITYVDEIRTKIRELRNN